MKRGETCHFLVRRNPIYARRRQLIASLNIANKNSSFDANSTLSSISDEDANSLLDLSMDSMSEDLQSLLLHSGDEDDCSSSTGSTGSSDTSSSEGSTNSKRLALCKTNNSTAALTLSPRSLEVCSKCRNSFKSCEFCQKTVSTIPLQRHNSTASQRSSSFGPVPSYSPVYNIREIRTATHSFSSLGKDKKLLDIHLNGRFDPASCRMRPQSVYCMRPAIMSGTAKIKPTSTVALTTDVNGNNANSLSEAVNNNPSKGLGHFVYL